MISEQWDVVLARFPFADAPHDKLRPVLVLSTAAYNAEHDLTIVVMTTSAMQGRWSMDHEVVDAAEAGLNRPCVVRYKIATLARHLMSRRLGSFGDADRSAVATHLATILPTGTLPPS